MLVMRQQYHTIIEPRQDGRFVGWVEEIPGTITHGRSLPECRARLRDALELMLETRRHESRLGSSDRAIHELIDVDVSDDVAAGEH